MRGKSTYIILIIILLVFLVVMFLIYGVDSIRKTGYQTTIVVGDNTTWKYKDKRWSQVTKYDDFQELNWQKFTVFEDSRDLGDYFYWHDDKWYLFDSKRNAFEPEGNIVAYNSNYDINVDSYTVEEADTDQYIEKVLLDNELDKNSEFTKAEKVRLDFDSDGEIETFYIISNVFPLEFKPERIFSFVFMVKNNQIYYLYNESQVYRAYSGCSPEFLGFLDTNEDDTDEIILGCHRYSNLGRIDMLYTFTDNNFKIVISNQ